MDCPNKCIFTYSSDCGRRRIGGSNEFLAGSGGGAGGTIRATVAVTPGEICDIQVGFGGIGIAAENTTEGINGENSTFNCSNLYLQAQGGQGGNSEVINDPPARGGTGIVTGSDVLYFILIPGQDGSGLAGGGSEGEGAPFTGTFSVPSTKGRNFGGGGAGALSIYVNGIGFNSSAGGDGVIMISYVQEILL